jgi:tRNA-modifying protein YgfZ
MEHRHIARRRLVTASAPAALTAGAEISANGRSIGTLTSSSEGVGLALVRLDRAKEAIDRGETLTAAGATVTLAIPRWARFGWPASGAGGS